MSLACNKIVQKLLDYFPYNILEPRIMIQFFMENTSTLESDCGFYYTSIMKELKNRSLSYYYNSDSITEYKKSIKFTTVDENSIIFEACSNTEWSKEKEADFRFLSQLIFISVGRAVSMKLMKETLTIDSLTRIPNKNVFDKYVEEVYEKGELKNYNIYFLNLSNMKFINTKYGESNGNLVLIRFAENLQKASENIGVVARLGGSSFIALLKKDQKENFEKAMSNKYIELETPNTGKTTIHIEFHAGMYSIKEVDTPSNIITMSVIALDYGSSKNQKGIVEFQDFMLEQLVKQKSILTMFEDAINNEEFQVFYQPKVDIEKGKLCGAEALVRWFHDGKMISPGDFISVLEDNNLIHILDFYVFKHILIDIKNWINNGIEPVRISSNFSKTHLNNPKFAENIINLVEELQVPTKYVELEFTETKDIKDMKILSDFVEIMHEHNIHSSIDDFGTGYSSLNLIKNVKADVIKLDKSIIDNIGMKNGDDEILVQNIVRMIFALKKNAIAEGVENSEQAKFLKGIGCKMIQGYLFDKPLPKNEFEERLKNPTYEIAGI